MTVYAYENILKRIPHKLIKLSNNTVKCKCISPIHRDDTPSLTITDKSDKVLIHCFGCSGNVDDILSGIGLTKHALYDKFWNSEEEQVVPSSPRKSNLDSTLDFLKNPDDIDPYSIISKTFTNLDSDEVEEYSRVIALVNNKFLKENNRLDILDKYYNNFEMLGNLYDRKK